MRKTNNKCKIEGYIYDADIESAVTGESSKKPGTPYYRGTVNVAVNEEGTNVIEVHFQYVPEFFNSGKRNNSFDLIKGLCDNTVKTWIKDGKEEACKVKIDGNIDFREYTGQDGQRVTNKQCRGSFITQIQNFGKDFERNNFDVDMLINRVTLIEANPEKRIDTEYVELSGFIFNYRNEFFPTSFIVKNPEGKKYLLDLEISNTNPLFTRVWGKINNTVTIDKTVQEAAFGEDIISTYKRYNREWLAVGIPTSSYGYGEDEMDMTPEDVKKGLQDIELRWADIKKREEEKAQKKASESMTGSANAFGSVSSAPSPAQAVAPGDFKF